MAKTDARTTEESVMSNTQQRLTKEAFREMMGVVFDAYRKPRSLETVDAYYSYLSNRGPITVARALDKHIRTEKFFPSIAEILQALPEQKAVTSETTTPCPIETIAVTAVPTARALAGMPSRTLLEQANAANVGRFLPKSEDLAPVANAFKGAL
jgi:hypothetical protein